MTYAVVEVDRGFIKLLHHHVGDTALATAQANARQANRQIWPVDDIEETRATIKRHNEVLAKVGTKGQQAQVKEQPEEMMWRWERTDEDTRANLLRLYNDQTWGQIMIIHNDLKLTDETYCCGSFIPKIQLNMDKAIADGIFGGVGL